MRINRIKIYAATVFAFFCTHLLQAQDSTGHRFTHLKLEMRADFEVDGHYDDFSSTQGTNWGTTDYGFYGRYFNLHLGGEFGKGFSYYFRQRIIANDGLSKFFDNTDFLYLDYRLNDSWSFRAGKDALSVGGFEYDASPIDVLFSSFYWDNFYCFQLGVSAAYTTRDRNHTLRAQVATSPYVHFGSKQQNSLFAYSFLWSGKFSHLHLLYSASMMERERGRFMSYLALGHKVEFDRWNLYVDLIHRATSTSQLTKNFAVIGRAEYDFRNGIALFAKAGYEQNFDTEEVQSWLITDETRDCLSQPGLQYYYYGVGLEYRPVRQPNVRVHAFVANYRSKDHSLRLSGAASDAFAHSRLTGNVGVIWDIDFVKYFHHRHAHHHE